MQLQLGRNRIYQSILTNLKNKRYFKQKKKNILNILKLEPLGISLSKRNHCYFSLKGNFLLSENTIVSLLREIPFQVWAVSFIFPRKFPSKWKHCHFSLRKFQQHNLLKQKPWINQITFFPLLADFILQFHWALEYKTVTTWLCMRLQGNLGF